MRKHFFIAFSIIFSLPSFAQVYKNAEYIFSVQIFDKNDNEVAVVFNEPHNFRGDRNIYDSAWSLVPKDSSYRARVSYISMKLFDGTINGDQKAYFLRIYNSKFKELSEGVTGLIENDSLIWFHPAREKFFKILEINPFPEIRFDKKKWSTSLKVGDQWGNDRWKTWKGNVTIKSEYKIEGDKVIAIANSKLGTSKLISTFDKKKGFTSLYYTNIDGSRILLDLIEIKAD